MAYKMSFRWHIKGTKLDVYTSLAYKRTPVARKGLIKTYFCFCFYTDFYIHFYTFTLQALSPKFLFTFSQINLCKIKILFEILKC